MSMLQQFTGATVRRVIDPGRAVIREHAHDWPLVSLYVQGSYRNVTECGERIIAGPSMVFYRPGVAHQNVVGEAGFEQIEIEFDPQWLGSSAMPLERVLLCVGGACGALSRSIARACNGPLSEEHFLNLVRRLLLTADQAPKHDERSWPGDVAALLRADPSRSIESVARELGRSPAWIGPAYRRLTGERPQETAARFRVERATQLLRESDDSLVEVATVAGFCDQSHMNRSFRRVLGRLPTSVRRDRDNFRD